jgi:hypothetical protein
MKVERGTKEVEELGLRRQSEKLAARSQELP